ncbi:hypothetical protein JAAARDRAFT_172208 [Jaapia argillacea MUCL 33604]|uniref:Large ribosomal subunit protein mL44 n=1 Tax=Jaapia argillacea MUCL 33604 TaxID=933084 RepID=A0A067Q458_9AGAM|nr:hypothetical protein JAAARDRAFT_172208 [Jaapia argillacea MUCL 33604]
MSLTHKRLASTAAKLKLAKKTAISTSHLKAFPPPEASSSQFFNPKTWATLQPPPPSSLSAFAHRIGLGQVILSPSSPPSASASAPTGTALLQQALTHPSFVPLFQKHYPNEPLPLTNANLNTVGNGLMGLFAAEWLNAAYPHLPTRVLKAAVSAYVGPVSCANVAKEWGVVPLLRWNRTPSTPLRPAVLHTDALSSVPRALTALIYTHRSLPTARKFVHNFFLSRDVDLRGMIKFRDPKKALSETVARFGRERPVSRLLRETGRFSNSPIFVVGIYSGSDLLGEGFGSSLKMAEFRAAEDSLHRLYLTRTPSHLLSLPTTTFSTSRPSMLDAIPASQSVGQGEGGEGVYVPGELGVTEVLYGSSERSGVKVVGRPVGRGFVDGVEESGEGELEVEGSLS